MKRKIIKSKSSRCKDLARKVRNSATLGDFLIASGNGYSFGNVTIKNSNQFSAIKEKAKTVKVCCIQNSNTRNKLSYIQEVLEQ